jgi:hypothetical protein
LAAVQALWSKALEDLEVLRRQSMVYSLYSRKLKNVMVSLPSAAVCTAKHELSAPGITHTMGRIHHARTTHARRQYVTWQVDTNQPSSFVGVQELDAKPAAHWQV